MESKGIKETEELALELVAFANASVEAMADGKLSLSDLPKFVGPLTGLPGALSGITEVPAEMADLDSAEFKELASKISEKLNVAHGEHAAAITEASVDVGVALLKLVSAIKASKAA